MSIFALLLLVGAAAQPSPSEPPCIFDGADLRTHEGATVDGCSSLSNKSVAVYFSGEWCPLCRRFTPALREFHERYHDSVEVVFVSSDANREDADQHFARSQGNWLQLAYDDAVAAKLKRKHRVWSGREVGTFGYNRRSGVPCVVVIDVQGDEVAFLAGERFGAAALREWEPEQAARWPAGASIKAEL